MMRLYWPQGEVQLVPIPRESFDLMMSEQQMRAAFDAVGADLIVHLAGVTPSGPRAVEESDYHRLNAEAAIRAMAATDRPFFLASSASVYGGVSEKVHELSQLAPVGAYGKSKAEADLAARDFPHVTVLRYSTIAGADQLLQNALRAGPDAPMQLDRFSDGAAPVRSYIGPHDLVRVHYRLSLALREGISLPPVLNIAAPKPVAMDRLLASFARISGRDIPCVSKVAPEDAIRHLAFDTRRLARLYRFDGAGAGPEGIARQAVEWFRADGQIAY